jgi:hypothetical protein
MRQTGTRGVVNEKRDEAYGGAERHVSMLSIARRIRRYMPTLMNYCNRRKIYMLLVRDGVGQRYDASKLWAVRLRVVNYLA